MGKIPSIVGITALLVLGASGQVDESTPEPESCQPQILLNGDAIVTVEAYTGTYTEEGAVPSCGSDTIVIGGDVVGTTPGQYIVTYDILQGTQSVAQQLTRTVNVVDRTPPIVTCPSGLALGDYANSNSNIPSSAASFDGSSFGAVVVLETDPGTAHSGVDLSLTQLEASGFSRSDGSTTTDMIERIQPDGTVESASFGNFVFPWNPSSTATLVAIAGTIVITTTDAAQNSANCTIAVLVVDVEAPTLTCPSQRVVERLGTADGIMNRYTHPETQAAAFVYATDPSTLSATVQQLPQATVADNSEQGGGSVSFVIDRGVIEQDGSITFTSTAQIMQHVFLWNSSSSGTTEPLQTDANNDGLLDHDPAGGQIAGLSGYLLFVATDATGNQQSCTTEVYVVDLEDPVITCPTNAEVPLSHAGSEPGNQFNNIYIHPTTASNYNHALIIQTQDDSATSAGTAMPQPTAVSDNGPLPVGVSYTIHRRDIAGPSPSAIFNQDVGVNDLESFHLNSETGNTTQPLTDVDGDGLVDSGLFTGVAGQEGAVSSILKFVVTDQSGNRGSCVVDVVVVDLQDPVIACPASVGLNLVSGENRYDHPSSASNFNSVLVYLAGTTGPSTVGSGENTEPPTVSQLSDNSANGASGTVAYTVHRRNIYPVPVSPNFDATNIATTSQDYDFNPQTSLTTQAIGDVDGDGLLDTVGNGNAAEPSAVLQYVAHDQAGNQAACAMDVVVVDLVDPVITCPASIHVNDLTNSDGDAAEGRGTNTNSYVHPSTASNFHRVFVYQTDPGQAVASIGTTPVPLTRFTNFNDNCRPDSAAFTNVALDYDVHRTATNFLDSNTMLVFDSGSVKDQVQSYPWNPASVATTVSQGDGNNDGIFDVDAVDRQGSVLVRTGGQEALRSATLRYVAEDASGNRASCDIDIVVVDLEDPSITCPSVVTSASMVQADGSSNDYVHPATAINSNYVQVYRLDAGSTVATATPSDATTTDNTHTTPSATSLDYAIYRKKVFPLLERSQFENTIVDVPANEIRGVQVQFNWNWSVIGTTLQTVSTGIRVTEAGADTAQPASFDATNLTMPVDSTGLLGDLGYGNVEIPDHYPGPRSAEGAVSEVLIYVVSDQSGNRASCQREVVVVDLEDPVVDCTNVLLASLTPKILYDGRTCIGANSTSNPPQVCIPRDINDVNRDPEDANLNENIFDAISLNLPTRTDNTDNYIVGTHVADDVVQFLEAGGSGFGSIDNGEYAVSGITATYGGFVPHYFGVRGLDRHPLREAPVITLLTPATRAVNTFNVHFDLFDRSGNRAECSISNRPIEVEVRCSAIKNWRFVTDGVTPGIENAAEPCECCAALNAGQPIPGCPTDMCAGSIYEFSTGCGGGWPETTAGDVGTTMCYPRIGGELVVLGDKSRQCLDNGVWEKTGADVSQCVAAAGGGLEQFEVAKLGPENDGESATAIAQAVQTRRRLARQRRESIQLTCDSTFVDFVAACPEDSDEDVIIEDSCLKDKIIASAATWLNIQADAFAVLNCEAVPSVTPCFHRSTFDAGFGTCETYESGSDNFGYCDQDVDTDAGDYGDVSIRADEACSECGVCADPISTESPTQSPTTSAPTIAASLSPTQSPTASPNRAAAPTFASATTQNTDVTIGFSICQSGSGATSGDAQGSTDATSLITGAPTTGRRRRSGGPAKVLSRSRRDLFDDAIVNNSAITAEEARNVALRAARVHVASGKNISAATGATITVPCRAKLNSNGVASVVDANGFPTDAAERCTDTDPDNFCAEIPGCTETIDARISLSIDSSFSFPFFCPNRVWEGQSTDLFEPVPVATTGKKSSPKKGSVQYQPNPTIVELLSNASDGANPRVPQLATHCPNIASALVQGDGTASDGAEVGESCGRRYVRQGTPKSGVMVETYVCDYVDLTVGCVGQHGNPRDPQIQEACAEVCAAVGPSHCTAYTVDLSPVDLSDPDTTDRSLFGRCLLFNRPLEDFTNYDFTSTTASPTTSPKGMSTSPKSPKSTPIQTLKFHHECQMTSAVIDVNALPAYPNEEDLCDDPVFLLELELPGGTSGKSPKSTAAPFDFSCPDIVVTESPTQSPTQRPSQSPKKSSPKKTMGKGMASMGGGAPAPVTSAPTTRQPTPGKGSMGTMGSMGNMGNKGGKAKKLSSPAGGGVAKTTSLGVTIAAVAVVIVASAMFVVKRYSHYSLQATAHDRDHGDFVVNEAFEVIQTRTHYYPTDLTISE